MTPSSSSGTLRVRACSTLSAQPTTWFWTNWLAQGRLVILDGDPGLGKSLIALDLCARFSTGRPMPDGTPGPGPATALVLNAEDGNDDTVPNRAAALGADMARVFVVDRDEIDWAEPVRLPSQIGALEKVVDQYQAKLLVIDPLVAFLESRISINVDQSLRQALYPLHKLALRKGCTVLMLRHLNKKNDWRARYRGGGSIGLVGTCRCAWMVERDPDVQNQYVLAQVKNSDIPLEGSLAYAIPREAAPADGSTRGH